MMDLPSFLVGSLVGGLAIYLASRLVRDQRELPSGSNTTVNVQVTGNERRMVVADTQPQETEYEMEVDSDDDDDDGDGDGDDEVDPADWWKKGKKPYGNCW